MRGLPAFLLYRSELSRGDQIALALFSSTHLPLVVAITSIGVSQGQMRQSTAAALVTAAVVSVVLFPAIAIALRRRAMTRSASP